MRLSRSFRLSVAAVACTGLMSLAACSEDSEPEPRATESSETPAEEAPEADEDAAEEVDTDTDTTTSEGTPEWAAPATEVKGELISTIEAGDVTVEAYQVGTDKASKDGMFVDPETRESLLAEGDPIVFVNFVITNNGDPIDLGASLVKVTPKYDDWKWGQGMDIVTDKEQYDALGLNTGGLAADAFRDPSVYTFGTGETFAYAQGFRHQKNSPITFEVSVIPVDAEGDLIHDEGQKATGSATIA